MRPPARCTASVVRRQPSIWAWLYTPGSCQKAEFPSITIVASATIRPALARWP